MVLGDANLPIAGAGAPSNYVTLADRGLAIQNEAMYTTAAGLAALQSVPGASDHKARKACAGSVNGNVAHSITIASDEELHVVNVADRGALGGSDSDTVCADVYVLPSSVYTRRDAHSTACRAHRTSDERVASRAKWSDLEMLQLQALASARTSSTCTAGAR